MDWQLLNARRLPARLNYEQVATLAGVSSHDVPILVQAGLVPVLNNSSASRNSVKWVAASALEPLLRDPRWAARVTSKLILHWRSKNERRGAHRASATAAPVLG